MKVCKLSETGSGSDLAS